MNRERGGCASTAVILLVVVGGPVLLVVFAVFIALGIVAVW